MIKKFVIAAVFAASAMTTVSATPAKADPNEYCLLHAGCFFTGTRWMCPDPNIYMLCIEE